VLPLQEAAVALDKIYLIVYPTQTTDSTIILSITCTPESGIFNDSIFQ